MQVILIKDVENLGFTNDIVEVRPGYANNYLIPQGLAKSATAAARKVLAENLKQRAHKDAKLKGDAEALAAQLNAVKLSFKVKAEEGRIFGSITAADIAEALTEKGFSVDRKQVTLDTVKTVGQYEATVYVYKKEVAATVKFEVVSDAPAKEAKKEEATTAPEVKEEQANA